MLTVALVALSAASAVLAQAPPFVDTPLISRHFPSPTNLPYHVDPYDSHPRGPQQGYNLCNSTTENQDSMCVTFFMNSPDDFCIPGAPKPGKPVADQEGEMVAWCTKKGHGTRLIPNGAIKGLEYRKTPDYIQIVGKIDQTLINIPQDDFGGEMDSGAADGRGNPIGGLVFSSAFSGQPEQIIYWTCFMGGNLFGCKACDPNKPDQKKYCEHIYDRIGIVYNAPNNMEEGKFVSCEAPNAEFPGVYTSNGQTLTYTQPPEGAGAITSMPYTPTVPPVSNCKTLTSADLFQGLPTASSAATSGKAGASGSGSGASSKPTGAAASGSSTGSAAGSKSTDSGAEALAISAASSILGVVFAALFLS